MLNIEVTDPSDPRDVKYSGYMASVHSSGERRWFWEQSRNVEVNFEWWIGLRYGALCSSVN